MAIDSTSALVGAAAGVGAVLLLGGKSKSDKKSKKSKDLNGLAGPKKRRKSATAKSRKTSTSKTKKATTRPKAKKTTRSKSSAKAKK